MEQENYFNNLISNEEYFYDMPDCISECSDYKELFEKSFNLTNGQLNLQSFKCFDKESKFQFDLTVNERHEKIEVKKISDYVDTNGLISGLNLILKNSGVQTQKQFVDLVGGPVDFGVAFIPIDKEIALAKNGLIWRSDKFYSDLEQLNKTNILNTHQKLDTKIAKDQNKPWWKFW